MDKYIKLPRKNVNGIMIYMLFHNLLSLLNMFGIFKYFILKCLISLLVFPLADTFSGFLLLSTRQQKVSVNIFNLLCLKFRNVAL